jgi:hypothetical protein
MMSTNEEYDRGFEDGYSGYPSATDATLDYDCGYEQGRAAANDELEKENHARANAQ